MVPVISELWKYGGNDIDLKKKKKREHQCLCTDEVFSIDQWKEMHGGQIGWGKHLLTGGSHAPGAEYLSNLCLIWVENAEPGSRDRTESGCRHRNVRISLLFPKMEFCNLLGMSLMHRWCGSVISWGSATSHYLLFRLNPFSTWNHLWFFEDLQLSEQGWVLSDCGVSILGDAQTHLGMSLSDQLWGPAGSWVGQSPPSSCQPQPPWGSALCSNVLLKLVVIYVFVLTGEDK